MKTIGITGGTGFIGGHLTALLIKEGYEVIIFSRNPEKESVSGVTYAHWNAETGACDMGAFKKLDAIVNLAGAGIADKKWTEKRKKEITGSRINGTNFLVSLLKKFAPDCKTLISASATGFYGPDCDGALPFTENAPPYHDFLGNTCSQWEQAAQKANEFARVVILRFGIVMGKESGAFPQLAKPMQFGIMPILGSGKQIVSWIEVDDLARLILFAIENERVSGTYNAVSPDPVPHKQLMKTIALAKGGMKIPIPVPAFLLKTVLGEMSGEILKSCTASAQKTIQAGFTFNYPRIETAVKTILEDK